MLKDKTTAIGIGLAGETVGLEFQIRNYTSYLMNGSTQDNQTLTGAKNVMVQGNLKICGKQTVMNIYCCLSDFEKAKKSIRHEVLHYMLYIAGFQYKDDSAIFHYFCDKYDAHAYKEMQEEQQQLYDKLQNAEVALTQMKEIPEDQKDAAVNGMIVTIGVTEENEELYKDR